MFNKYGKINLESVDERYYYGIKPELYIYCKNNNLTLERSDDRVFVYSQDGKGIANITLKQLSRRIAF